MKPGHKKKKMRGFLLKRRNFYLVTIFGVTIFGVTIFGVTIFEITEEIPC